MKKYHWMAVLIALIVLTMSFSFKQSGNEVDFPDGYRSWTRVKSEVILEGHENYNSFGGFHHVYANNKALSSLKDGESFENGSVLVFDLMEEKVENNTITEGTRKVIGVMVKDQKRFPETEGWGFEDFKAGDPIQRSVTDMKNQCFTCHKTQKETDYVYSKYHF